VDIVGAEDVELEAAEDVLAARLVALLSVRCTV
jgi:hypothetical protein